MKVYEAYVWGAITEHEKISETECFIVVSGMARAKRRIAKESAVSKSFDSITEAIKWIRAKAYRERDVAVSRAEKLLISRLRSVQDLEAKYGVKRVKHDA